MRRRRRLHISVCAPALEPRLPAASPLTPLRRSHRPGSPACLCALYAPPTGAVPLNLPDLLCPALYADGKDYLNAALITLGCTLFLMTGSVKSKHASSDSSVFGLLLMLGYLGFDGFTSTFQDKLFKVGRGGWVSGGGGAWRGQPGAVKRVMWVHSSPGRDAACSAGSAAARRHSVRRLHCRRCGC